MMMRVAALKLYADDDDFSAAPIPPTAGGAAISSGASSGSCTDETGSVSFRRRDHGRSGSGLWIGSVRSSLRGILHRGSRETHQALCDFKFLFLRAEIFELQSENLTRRGSQLGANR